MVLALDSNLVVGQVRAIMHFHPDLPTELYLDNLGVDPAYQHRGIATKLMTKNIQLGKEKGAEEIWLGTEPDNDQGVSFYKAKGMKIEQMVMFYDTL